MFAEAASEVVAVDPEPLLLQVETWVVVGSVLAVNVVVNRSDAA